MIRGRKRNISNSRAATTRLITQRTCAACRRVTGKRAMVRLVRNREGVIEIDLTGKKSGRGTYLCPSRECWENALKGNRLEHALHTSLSRENREQLIRQGEDIIKGVTEW